MRTDGRAPLNMLNAATEYRWSRRRCSCKSLAFWGVEVAATAEVVSLGSGEHPLTLELKLLWLGGRI